MQSREKNDRYPEDRQRSRRDGSLTRYCMTTTTIVGDSCTALSIWTRSNLWSRAASTTVIYMKTPKRIFPSHSPDFCVESLARSLGRGAFSSTGDPSSPSHPRPTLQPQTFMHDVVSTIIPAAAAAAAPYAIKRIVDMPPSNVRANSVHRRAN